MIRDPSDGSVRDIPKSGPVRKAPQNIAERLPSSDAAGAGPDTGIRQPTKTDAMMRLEFSREWLKNYHAKKERQHERGNSIGEELQAAGHSIEGERETESGTSPSGSDTGTLGES